MGNSLIFCASCPIPLYPANEFEYCGVDAWFVTKKRKRYIID